jgi:hypothetical protein
MITFKILVLIEGNTYSVGQTIDEVPEVVEKNWYFKHLVETGDIVIEKSTAKSAKPKE